MAKRKPSDCRKKQKDGKCSGKYKLTYESQAPIYTCDRCGDTDYAWKKFYDEYLQLFRQKENWSDKKAQISCIIGFFCYMYEQFYNTPYVFVPRSPNPFSCKETKDAWKLLAAFEGDAHSVRRYIHWFFKRFVKSNTSVVSFAYINTAGIVRKYNLYNRKKHSVTRSTQLPGVFVEWCKSHAPNIFNSYELGTINDLGALLSHVQFYGAQPDDIEFRVIEQAKQLDLIKDGRLNIKE